MTASYAATGGEAAGTGWWAGSVAVASSINTVKWTLVRVGSGATALLGAAWLATLLGGAAPPAPPPAGGSGQQQTR